MANQTNLYLIHCLTNLHAGSGDSTYGIVDKEVQKDPIEEMPVIHASGLKGAFRELFEYHDNTDVEIIFGSDSKAQNNSSPNSMKAGQYFFLEARLLFLPVRSSRKPFYFATSPEILQTFIECQRNLGTGYEVTLNESLADLLTIRPEKNCPTIFSAEGGDVFLDEYDANVLPPISVSRPDWPFNGSNIALFHHDDLKDICKRLPVIARNYLENGISSNLWYEEIVPRHSLFYFFVSHPTENSAFETQLNADNIKHNVQIGGNASVGYGLCKLLKY